MKLIDVTLRDGGHTCDFDWPEVFVDRLLSTANDISTMAFVEVGYWMQSAKFLGRHYSVGPELLEKLQSQCAKPLAVMIDFHYRTVSPQYLSADGKDISLLRLTARKTDVDGAALFLSQVKQLTEIEVSLNLSNISNYSPDELMEVSRKLAKAPIDMIYLADTHGNLNLSRSGSRFRQAAEVLWASGKKVGFHLHNHRGYALLNFTIASEWGFDFSDVSLGGLGKGGGNLKTEQVVDQELLHGSLELKRDFAEQFAVPQNPFFVLTGIYSVVDHYAVQLFSHGVKVGTGAKFLATICGEAKDVYDNSLLPKFLGEVV